MTLDAAPPDRTTDTKPTACDGRDISGIRGTRAGQRRSGVTAAQLQFLARRANHRGMSARDLERHLNQYYGWFSNMLRGRGKVTEQQLDALCCLLEMHPSELP